MDEEKEVVQPYFIINGDTKNLCGNCEHFDSIQGVCQELEYRVKKPFNVTCDLWESAF